jgi:two-component system, chemotaxis family, sensor kinase Cph1
MQQEYHVIGSIASDITNCEKEPIHLTQFIQPHGVLFALDRSNYSILQVSENTPVFFRQSAEHLVGKNISLLFSGKQQELLDRLHSIGSIGTRPVYLGNYSCDGSEATFDVIAHQQDQCLILEFVLIVIDEFQVLDPAELYEQVFIKLLNAENIKELTQSCCKSLQDMSGFDRIMIYKFDDEGHGDVIAETVANGVDSFLGLHYPESDIPKQARELYKKNWTRIIPDISQQPIPLFPQLSPIDKHPLDQSLCVLRSLSPVHIEYLRNMQVTCSMSISIIVKGQLWGLISCHHLSPKYISYKARMTYEFLGQVLSTQIFNLEETEMARYRNQVFLKQQDIIQQLRKNRDYVSNIYAQGDNILNLVEAQGFAFYFGGNCSLWGETPTRAQVADILNWLTVNVEQEVFATKSLSSYFPEANAFRDVASGLLALAISKEHGDYLLLFRQEIVQTVNWAGDPRKPVEVENGRERLTPRKSFELWKETVTGKALAWTQSQIEAAHLFRNALLNVLLSETIDELSFANNRLIQSNKDLENFASVASHDMQAPLRKAKLFTAQVMEEAEKLKPDNRDALRRAIASIDNMQTLIHDVLSLARINKTERDFEKIDMSQVLDRALNTLDSIIREKKAKIEVENLGVIWGDPVQIELLLQNLIENGLKYQPTGQIPVIKVRMQGSANLFSQIEIEDNGIGFKPEQAQRIFEPFERLHGKSVYAGSGIGLAICKRIVERHAGKIEALGEPGIGSKFIITLPNKMIS